MAFTLPSDLPTNVVDDVSEVNAAFFNNMSGMGNATKAALAAFGFNPAATTIATSESTTSTSYVDLTTTTDSVTVPIGSSGKALVIIRVKIDNQADIGAYVSYALSGANTVAATDTKCIRYWYKGTLSAVFLEESLTAGFTTFKLKYKATSGTATFANRHITVIPFPSNDGTNSSGTFSLDATSLLALGMSGAGLNRPTYDALGAGYYNTSANTGGSFSHTGTAGATPILAVALGISTNDGVFSATYNGTPMTELARCWDSNTASTGLVLYGALGACTGSACTVTFASSKSIDQAITMNCASYVGVGSFGKPSYASGNGAPTITTTSLTPGSLAVNGIRLQMSTAVVGYNQTSRFADNRGSYQSVVLGECAAQSTAGASVTFSATSSTYYSNIVVPLLPSAYPIMADKTSTSTTASATKNITSTTFSHTGTSGTTPVVAVSVASDSAPFLSSTIACTYNGSDMTLIGYVPCYSTYDMGVALFIKVGACTGSACDVVVTNSPATAAVQASCVSYTNVTSAKAPTLQAAGTAQPSVTVASASGDRIVASWHNHYSGAKGYSQATGMTRYNDNTYRIASAANLGTSLTIDAPASTGTTSTLSAYTTVSYGNGGLGAALSTASPTSIAFDAVGGGGTKAGAGTMSWTHNINGNFLLIYAPYYNVGGFTMTATVGGQDISANTDYYTWYNDGSNFIHMRWYWMYNPPQGSQSVVITYSGGGPVRSSANSLSYTNVGTFLGPLTTGASNATPTGTAMKMTTGGIYVCGMSGNFSSAAPGTSYSAFSKTQRYNQPGISSLAQPLVIGDTAGSASDVTFTATQPSCNWGTVIFPLVPTTYT